MVVCIQTFGDRINLHPHLHCLVSEGGEDEQGRFHHVQTFDDPLISELFSREVFALLLGEELISEEMVEKIFLCPDGDFYSISGTSELFCGFFDRHEQFPTAIDIFSFGFIFAHDGYRGKSTQKGSLGHHSRKGNSIILVFDQGQSDASMKNPPKYDPVVNNRDFSRLSVLQYSKDVMKVDIFDFVHTEDRYDFYHASIDVAILLKDDWDRLLSKGGFTNIEYFGDWKFTKYDKDLSQRLLAIAQK